MTQAKGTGRALFVFALGLVFLSPWGYAHIPALSILLPLSIVEINVRRVASVDLALLLSFSLAYTLVIFVNQGMAPGGGTLLKYLLMPSVFFLAGNAFGFRLATPESFVKISLLLLSLFSAVVVLSISIDIYQNGFISDSRNMQIFGQGEDLKNATGINTFLAVWLPMIGLVFYRARSSEESKLKFALIAISLISLVYSLRLGSRTGVSTMVAGVLVLFFFNFGQYRTTGKLSLTAILVLLMLAGSYALDVEDLTVAYQDRLESDDFGTSSAGGRVDLWEYYFDRLLEYPLGSIPAARTDFMYAHNYFLDVAKVSGLVPMVLIVLFTAVSVWRLFKVLQSGASPLTKNFLLGLNIAFYLVFMVEPVIEGCFTLFCLYLFYCGVVKDFALKAAWRRD